MLFFAIVLKNTSYWLRMAKRKKKKSDKNSKLLTYIAWSLGIIALLLSTLLAGYYLGYENAKTDNVMQDSKKKDEKLSTIKEHKEDKKEKEEVSKEEDVKKRLKEILKKPTREYISASHEYDAIEGKIPPAPEKKVKKLAKGKPKLAIILDDVCIRRQVRDIKNLHLKITMSFLPPNSRHPNSAKLASNESFYMVHLPMEAMHFTAEEPTTLHVKDSQKEISQRIGKIKKLFPKVKYINNHTGSKFTADELSVNRLINVLNIYHINFIDSRTTSKTKVPKVMKNFGLKYMARDVFLDHRMDKEYVKKQIRVAVLRAKKYGSAIAIGHPHKNTLLALKESKKLLSEVELVYINQL